MFIVTPMEGHIICNHPQIFWFVTEGFRTLVSRYSLTRLLLNADTGVLMMVK